MGGNTGNGFDKRPQDINSTGLNKGAKHMTTILREAIQKVSEDTGEPADLAIVKKAIEDAKAGDHKARELVWSYLDGKPMQGIEMSGEGGGPIKVATTVTFVDAD